MVFQSIGVVRQLRTSVGILVILISLLIIYTLTLLSLDLTIHVDGFSPFKIWSPFQTIVFSILGFIGFILIILTDNRERKIDLKSLIYLLPIMLLSFLIQFTPDVRQLLNHFPILEGLFFLTSGSIYWTVIDMGSLIIYGGLLGILITYLHSISHEMKKMRFKSLLSDELLFKIPIVVVLAPGILTLGFTFLLSLATTFVPFLFPSYGEGTIGSILVVSVLLSMYISARLLKNWNEVKMSSFTQLSAKDLARFTIEVIAVYLCTAAAFSMIGGFTTDGTPIPLLVPINLVFLAILVTVPFSLLIAREKIFPLRVPQIDEEVDHTEIIEDSASF